MARQFNGTNQRLNVASSWTPASDGPFTLACWARPERITHRETLMVVSHATNGNQYAALTLAGDDTGDYVRAETKSSNANDKEWSETTTGFSANTWQHFAATFTSSSSRSSFLNGGNKGTNSNSSGTFTPQVSDIGCGVADSGTRSYTRYFLGRIANAGIWNVVLTDAEIAELATGVPCSAIRPDALVAWYRLFDADSDVDWWGQYNLTANGSPTYAADPPLIHPSSPKIILPFTSPFFRIGAGADDADYVEFIGSETDSGAVLNVGEAGFDFYAALLRFDVSIPQGATITSASLRITCGFGADYTGDTFTIDAADQDDPVMPTGGASTSISFTTATATDDFGNLTTGQRFATVDLASVIQEVVDRPGFGGSILLRVRSDSASSGLAFPIAAVENTDGWSPASLVAEWTVPAAFDPALFLPPSEPLVGDPILEPVPYQ